MLNIPELEKRWLVYKLKSYIPHLVIFVSLIVITSIVMIFSSNISKPEVAKTEIIKAPKKIVPQVKKVQVAVATKPQIVPPALPQKIEPKPSYQTKEKKVQLAPSLDFMKKIQNSQQPYYQNELEIPASRSDYTGVDSKPVVTKLQETPKKVTIKIQNTQNDIHDIIERFKKNNNPALSLFIARKSYELGDYEQAYNYALITNKINKNIESSWLIFVKSMVKLGKKDKAVKILDQYIQQSHSNSARILRDEINTGKFQ